MKAPSHRDQRLSRSERAARWLHDHRPGARMRDAACVFNISYQSVQKAWNRLYPDDPKPRVAQRRGATQIITELVRANEDLTLDELAAMAGCSKSKASYLRQRLKAPASPPIKEVSNG